MSVKITKFENISGIEFILLRQKLGFKRYIKTRVRDPEKKKILLDMAIKKIVDKEKEDFSPIGYRKRKLKIPYSGL